MLKGGHKFWNNKNVCIGKMTHTITDKLTLDHFHPSCHVLLLQY